MGTLTARNRSVTPPGYDIIITITKQTDLGCAPENRWFHADYSACGFSNTETYDLASGETFNGSYDPEQHGIVTWWRFGDSGDWLTPDELYDGWEAKNLAIGHKDVSHTYTAPVTAPVVECYAFEPATNIERWGRLVTPDVTDPEDAYDAIVCVNNNGDSDFTGAPIGAITRQLDVGEYFGRDTAGDIYNDYRDTNTMYLLKRGSTYTDARYFQPNDATAQHVYIGAYGTGAKPIMYYDEGALAVNGAHTFLAPNTGVSGTEKSHRFVDFVMEGTYDELTSPSVGSAGLTVGVSGGTKYASLIGVGLEFKKVSGLIAGTSGDAQSGENVHIAYADCDFSSGGRGGEYCYYSGSMTGDNTFISAMGCKFVDAENRVNDTSHKSFHRHQGPKHLHIRSCTYRYLTSSYQNPLKLLTAPRISGIRASMSFCVVKGPAALIAQASNSLEAPKETRCQNQIVRCCIFMLNTNGQNAFVGSNDGVTIDSCLMLLQRWSDSSESIRSAHSFAGMTRKEPEAIAGDVGYISVFGNTYLQPRTPAQENAANVPVFLTNDGGVSRQDLGMQDPFTKTRESGNNRVAPNWTPSAVIDYACQDDDSNAAYRIPKTGSGFLSWNFTGMYDDVIVESVTHDPGTDEISFLAPDKITSSTNSLGGFTVSAATSPDTGRLVIKNSVDNDTVMTDYKGGSPRHYKILTVTAGQLTLDTSDIVTETPTQDSKGRWPSIQELRKNTNFETNQAATGYPIEPKLTAGSPGLNLPTVAGEMVPGCDYRGRKRVNPHLAWDRGCVADDANVEPIPWTPR